MDNPSTNNDTKEAIKIKTKNVFPVTTIRNIHDSFSMDDAIDEITVYALFKIGIELKRLISMKFDETIKQELYRNFHYDMDIPNEVFEMLSLPPMGITDIINGLISAVINNANYDKELTLLIYLEHKLLNKFPFNDPVFVDIINADIRMYAEIVKSFMDDACTGFIKPIEARCISFLKSFEDYDINNPIMKIVSETDMYYVLICSQTVKTKVTRTALKNMHEAGLNCTVLNLYTGKAKTLK